MNRGYFISDKVFVAPARDGWGVFELRESGPECFDALPTLDAAVASAKVLAFYIDEGGC